MASCPNNIQQKLITNGGRILIIFCRLTKSVFRYVLFCQDYQA